MIRRLIILGLVAVPFAEMLVYLFLPKGTVPSFPDMRITKEYWALGFALASGLLMIYRHGFKPLKSPWILCFMFYLLFNIIKSSKIHIDLPGGDLGYYLNYRPAFKAFVFFIFFLTITSLSWPNRSKQWIFNAIFGVSLCSAGYIFVQFLNMDSIFSVRQPDAFGAITRTSTHLASIIGQPTLAGAFLAMCSPVALFKKNWTAFAIISLAVLLTQSSFAVLSIIISSLFYLICAYATKVRRFLIPIILVTASILIPIIVVFAMTHDSFNDNGRFSTWSMLLKDISTMRGSLFGMGFGVFGVVFPSAHQTNWFQAHNEFLQVLYGGGLIGLSLFVMMFVEIGRKFKDCVMDNEVICLASCLIAVSVCAIGTFVWQLGVFQYYTVLMFGLLTQLLNSKERVNA